MYAKAHDQNHKKQTMIPRCAQLVAREIVVAQCFVLCPRREILPHLRSAPPIRSSQRAQRLGSSKVGAPGFELRSKMPSYFRCRTRIKKKRPHSVHLLHSIARTNRSAFFNDPVFSPICKRVLPWHACQLLLLPYYAGHHRRRSGSLRQNISDGEGGKPYPTINQHRLVAVYKRRHDADHFHLRSVMLHERESCRAPHSDTLLDSQYLRSRLPGKQHAMQTPNEQLLSV